MTLPGQPIVLSTPLLSSVALSSVLQVAASRVGLLSPTAEKGSKTISLSCDESRLPCLFY